MSDTREAPTPLNGRIIGISLAAAMGGFLFGFDTAVINGAIDAMSEDFGISGFLQGFAVSSALLGCVLGAWFAGPLAARQGRIRVMLVASVLFTISAIGSGLAFGTWDLIAWRTLGGLGVGAASVIAPAYIAEVSPANVRGRLGSLQQLAIVIGIFAALLTDAFLADAAGGAAETLWLGQEAWRWMFLSEAVPAVLYGHGLAPRHLALASHATFLALDADAVVLVARSAGDAVVAPHGETVDRVLGEGLEQEPEDDDRGAAHRFLALEKEQLNPRPDVRHQPGASRLVLLSLDLQANDVAIEALGPIEVLHIENDGEIAVLPAHGAFPVWK